MDYISKKIIARSELNAFGGAFRDAAIQEQSRLEYMLLLILSYLWNKNIDGVGQEERLHCFHEIVRPSIGKVVDIARTLDANSEVFSARKNKKFVEAINKYPALRNEKFGHGFSFEDDAEKLYFTIKEIGDEFSANMPDVIGRDFEIIDVLTVDRVSYKGVVYKPSGEYAPWVTPIEAGDLSEGLYLKSDSSYMRISPFIKIENTDDLYIYSYMEDKLACRAQYNRLIKTGRKYFAVPDLVDEPVEIDEERKRSSNGTIVNIYSNNYKKYIETEIVKKVLGFLKKNESTVFATLWGHGGVGKTASIQRVCEALLTDANRIFDYIVLVSAKDRHFNYYKGTIEAVEGAVDSYDAVVRFINKVAFQENGNSPEAIVNFEGKMLIILDDYETFPVEEKRKLVDFIKSLNVAHHKVVITTRSANYITGEEIEVVELSKKETSDFFDSVLKNELGVDPDLYKQGLDIDRFKNALHELTSGRPLFIFQSAVIYGETGSIEQLMRQDLKNRKAAIDFLYGRILDYLSADAKLIFGVMGLIVSDSDLSNVLSKLKYLVNMEREEQRFDGAVGELEKLKIIKLIDGKFFRVYSSEIAQIMREAFSSVDDAGAITSRLQVVGNDKKMDNDLALLADADDSRVSHKFTEVVNKYRHIISRTATPEHIRIRAVVNLAQYLIEDTGDYEEGIKVLGEHGLKYKSNPEFVRVYTKYLWRGDDNSKGQAIEFIKKLLSGNSFKDESERLEFMCSLMLYETLMLTSLREDLKAKYRLGEIRKEDYDSAFSEQSRDFYRVYKYPGLAIYEKIKNDELKDFDHASKVRCLNALSSFMEICLRRRKYNDIDAIFAYVFNNLKYNYHEVFKRKLERVNKYRPNRIKNYDEYITPGSVGDRFAAAIEGNEKAHARREASALSVVIQSAKEEAIRTTLAVKFQDLLGGGEKKPE